MTLPKSTGIDLLFEKSIKIDGIQMDQKIRGYATLLESSDIANIFISFNLNLNFYIIKFQNY